MWSVTQMNLKNETQTIKFRQNSNNNITIKIETWNMRAREAASGNAM